MRCITLSLALLSLAALAPSAAAQADNCAGSLVTLPGVGAYPFTNVGATNSGAPAPCNSPSGGSSDVWWKWVAPYTGTFRFAICDADYDVVLALRGNCSGAVFACSDRDGCGTTQLNKVEVTMDFDAGFGVLIQIDGWNGAEGSGTLVISSPLGDSYCTSTTNSTGQAGRIRALGSPVLAESALVLVAENVPNQPGLFFYGTDDGNAPFNNGGTLCISGNIVRGPVTFATNNTAARPVNLPAAGIVAAGSYYFQYWFRDAQGPDFSNTTNGVKVVFQP